MPYVHINSHNVNLSGLSNDTTYILRLRKCYDWNWYCFEITAKVNSGTNTVIGKWMQLSCREFSLILSNWCLHLWTLRPLRWTTVVASFSLAPFWPACNSYLRHILYSCSHFSVLSDAVIIFGLRFAFFTHISGKKRIISKYVR